jgi:dihydroorotate dehydrogenase
LSHFEVLFRVWDNVRMTVPYGLIRPVLFGLDPELTHDLTLKNLGRAHALGMDRLLAPKRVEAPFELMGLRFANRVGLAAGLDKNGRYIDAFAAMGFGFIEVGTVTPLGQLGNPKPRMFRLPEAQALINRMGFNNEGLDAFLANVAQSKRPVPVGLNIGKNAATPIERAADDYLIGLKGVYAQADYITVNISSPNTKNLRALQTDEALDALLGALMQERGRLAEQHKKQKPLLVKIAPDLDEAQIDAIAQMLKHHCVDGVIATNTTLSREAIKGMAHADEAGGLSGAPVKAGSDAVVRRLRAKLGAGYPIIGVGGILSGQDAADKIAAGADLVQIYTGLIYKGPALVAEAARALKKA